MDVYKPPIRDMLFNMKAFGYTERVASLEAFQDYDIETALMMMQSTADILTKELLPLNKKGDEIGVSWDPETGDVKTPDGFREAYQTLFNNGMIGITGPVEYGGGGCPESLGVALGEMGTAVNKSFAMCPGLTRGLVDAIAHHATQEQKDFYLPKLVSGEWSGTMCLTEPQCGTDLGLITTKAVPDGDGYLISGTKIWITFGEHDMADNIIHFVLARLPDAPEGIKGISVFVVPKFIDGERNQVRCTGLEHKMGIHASPTCVMEFENAKGWLVGEENKGMRSMFTMMNAARLHVGIEGISLSDISYQTAVAFAKDRRQSRSLDASKSDPDAKADNILVHPDVRRMLLNVKASNEAMRSLAMWVAVEHDVSLNHPDEQTRQEADDLVALLTPVIKSYFTERGFMNISESMQVLGGAGYTTDWDIEQYMRDERIAMLYEGTNHIQALDLVGRKLPRKGGRLMQLFASRVTDMIRDNKEVEAMAEYITPLKELSKLTTGITMELATKGMEDPEIAGAVASNYLNLFALLALQYANCVVARYAIDNPGSESDTKLKTIRYFTTCILPEAQAYAAKIATGKANLFDFDVDEF